MAENIGIARRREQVQRLLIRGLSASEIANSIVPPVSEVTVKRDIAWIRKMNEDWWRSNSQVKARMMRYLKERLDAMREVGREGWLVVYEARDDLRMRVSGLNVVLGAEKAIGELLGFTGISLTDLEVQDRLEKMDVEITDLRRLVHLAENHALSA
ncbi:MAG: hypothetical protein HYU39_08525 [Thaumarchaeota archaeon]|nr:hypothetical protein [Nitrososphaerota archaeon]